MIYLSSMHVGSPVLTLFVGLQFRTVFVCHSESWNNVFNVLLITFLEVVVNEPPAFSSLLSGFNSKELLSELLLLKVRVIMIFKNLIYF